jgi:hypothetical protein
VNSSVAQRIASAGHRGQCTRFGDSVTAHLERVADAVPAEARAVAWLHDLLELVPDAEARLRGRGLTPAQAGALALLTRGAGEPYETHVGRIVEARGNAGRIARMVKLADLEDHLSHERIPAGAPPYGWARTCVLDRLGATSLAAASG